MAICSPPGGGKTFSALRFATALGKRICVINTESGAVEKYLGLSPDGVPFDFDIAEMPDFSPTRYTQLIQEAGRDGYDVIIIDSLSHAWAGSGGALELKDRKGGNSFTAWKDITPMHNAMIEAILRSPAHVIATMRTKVAYILEEQTNSKTGAIIQVPKKVGMEPVQRQGMEYEFDIVADMDNETHTLKVTKSRCPAVDGVISVKPGAEFIQPVKQWLEEGVPVDPSYYAVRPEDLRATQEVEAERVANQERAQAQATRQQQLLSMANGQAAGAAPIEQPPFDPAPVPQSPENNKATIEQLQELAALGQEIGRTPQQIADECKQHFGCGPQDLPQSKIGPLLNSFRQCAATAQEQAKNQSAA
jgi:hypothetical protein